MFVATGKYTPITKPKICAKCNTAIEDGSLRIMFYSVIKKQTECKEFQGKFCKCIIDNITIVEALNV